MAAWTEGRCNGPDTELTFWREASAPYARPTLHRSLLDIATSVLPYLALTVLMYLALNVSYEQTTVPEMKKKRRR